MNRSKKTFLLSFIAVAIISPSVMQAQRRLTESEALSMVMTRHPSVTASQRDVQRQEALRTAAITVPKTEISFMKGQYNSINTHDNNVTITQTLPFPTVWGRQRSLASATVKSEEMQVEVWKNDLNFSVRHLVQEIHYYKAQHNLYLRQDSLFGALEKAVALRYQVGDGTLLEKTVVETQRHEVQNALKQNHAALRTKQTQLQLILQSPEAVDITGEWIDLPAPDTALTSLTSNPVLRWWNQQTQLAELQKKVEGSKMLPELSVGYFNQTLIGYQTVDGQEQYFGSGDRFQGFSIGLSLPLFFPSYTAGTKAARIHYEASAYREQAKQLDLQQQLEQALLELARSEDNLKYYVQSALPNAVLLETQAVLAFKKGEIDHNDFLINLRQALSIRHQHLKARLDYNESILTLNHLTSIYE